MYSLGIITTPGMHMTGVMFLCDLFLLHAVNTYPGKVHTQDVCKA